MRILLELNKNGSMWSYEVASLLTMAPSTASETLARMAKDNEVRRIPSLSDSKRSTYRYSITTKGHDLLKLAYRHATGKDLSDADHG